MNLDQRRPLALDRTLEDDAVPVSPQTLPLTGKTLPDYLVATYHWAYLSPLGLAVFDHPAMVSAILWGNSRRLQRAAFAEIQPGQTVLQPACVYGDFSSRLARHLGPSGRLDVIDVAPIQVENCRRKLVDLFQARVWLADAAYPGQDVYDVVCCFFLLHELPADYKHKVVNGLLARMAPGGKAVFVDYHRPARFHPLRGVMNLVFRFLEPFAQDLCDHAIADYAERPEAFAWSTETYFGGLYRKTVARRL